MAGRKTGHQADQQPDQDGVEVEVDNHMYQTPFDSRNAY